MAASGFFGDLYNKAGDLINNTSNKQFSGLLQGAGQFGTAVLPYTLAQSEINNLKTLGNTLGTQAGNITQAASEAAQFQPFAVKTSTGTNTQINPYDTGNKDAEGNPISVPQLTTKLSGTEQTIQDQLLKSVNTMAGEPNVTAQSLYDQIRAMQMPEEERQRLTMQNSMFNQGRSGVQTAMYGGTPEELAYQKAVQEAQNAASFQAAQLAPQMAGQQIGNMTGMLTNAYLPQGQAYASMQPALEMSRLNQAGRQGQSEALYKGGIAGLEAQTSANLMASNAEAARTQALSNAFAGMFASPAGGGTSTAGGIFDSLLGYIRPSGQSAEQIVDSNLLPGYSYQNFVDSTNNEGIL